MNAVTHEPWIAENAPQNVGHKNGSRFIGYLLIDISKRFSPKRDVNAAKDYQSPLLLDRLDDYSQVVLRRFLGVIATIRGDWDNTSLSSLTRAVAVVSPGTPALIIGLEIMRDSWEG